MGGVVIAVNKSPGHTVSKPNQPSITLVEGVGVEGDVHAGATVQHVSRLKRGAEKPNLRQVHLMHNEFHEELAAQGLPVSPGQMGENVTTRGIDLLGLPTGTRLQLGDAALVEVTGVRNPCKQLDGIHEGLMSACLGRDEDGKLVRKAGIMTVVVTGGEIRPGDEIRVELPPEPHRPLEPV